MRRTGRSGCCRGSARPPGSRAAGNASAAGARARSWLSRSPRASSTFLDVDQSMKQGIMVRCTAPIRSMCRMIWASFGSSPGLRSRTAATVPATVPAVGQRLARPCEGERRDQSHLDAGFKQTVCEGSMVVPRSPRIRRPQDHRSGRAHRQTGHGPPLRSEPSFFAAASDRAPRSGSRREVLATSIATSTASFDVDCKVMVGLLSGGFWPNHRKRPDVRPWPPAALREGFAAGHGLFRASLPDVLWQRIHLP